MRCPRGVSKVPPAYDDSPHRPPSEKPRPFRAGRNRIARGCVRLVWNRTLAWRHQRWYGEKLPTNVPLVFVWSWPDVDLGVTDFAVTSDRPDMPEMS